VLFPHLLAAARQHRSLAAADRRALRSPERLLVCVAVKRPVESARPDDLHRSAP
jgi:hypothetical protein